ncbi:MAG: hypothetical protein M3P08_21115 [Thermoproteota archaeon]|nr:hypothetical protein [Thermoproteota archaeon]
MAKYFFRWFHNYKLAKDSGAEPSSDPSDWKTPAFANIKKKKTKRISPYSTDEIWEKDEVLSIVKYEPHIRNKAILMLLWDLDARNREVTLLKIKNIRFCICGLLRLITANTVLKYLALTDHFATFVILLSLPEPLQQYRA